jgi:hypothetical protein
MRRNDNIDVSAPLTFALGLAACSIAATVKTFLGMAAFDHAAFLELQFRVGSPWMVMFFMSHQSLFDHFLVGGLVADSTAMAHVMGDLFGVVAGALAPKMRMRLLGHGRS